MALPVHLDIQSVTYLILAILLMGAAYSGWHQVVVMSSVQPPVAGRVTGPNMVISNGTADAALVFVTILNRPHRDCCNLFASAVHHGILLHVIGWEHPDLNTWNPEGYFEVLSDYLQTVDEKAAKATVITSCEGSMGTTSC
eukprot:EG_transcript_42805